MITMTQSKKQGYVFNINDEFSKLRMKDIEPFIYLFKKWEIEIDDTILKQFLVKNKVVWTLPITTKFGETNLSNLATGYKVCMIAALRVLRNKPFCCMTALIGANAFYDLVEIARGTNLVSLYSVNHFLLPGDIKSVRDQIIFDNET